MRTLRGPEQGGTAAWSKARGGDTPDVHQVKMGPICHLQQEGHHETRATQGWLARGNLYHYSPPLQLPHHLHARGLAQQLYASAACALMPIPTFLCTLVALPPLSLVPLVVLPPSSGSPVRRNSPPPRGCTLSPLKTRTQLRSLQ